MLNNLYKLPNTIQSMVNSFKKAFHKTVKTVTDSIGLPFKSQSN